MNEYKSMHNLKKFNRVKSHYNRFLKRYSAYFKKMTHSIEIEFVSENTTLKVDLSAYTATSLYIYNKLKNIDADIQLVEQELRSFIYIQENDLHGENAHKSLRIKSKANMDLIDYVGADNQRIDTLIEHDIYLEKIQASPLEKYSRYNELIQIIESKLMQYKKLDYNNKLVEHNVDKLKYALMGFEYTTQTFREDIFLYEDTYYYYYLYDFKDFNSKYYDCLDSEN
ncbi:MAG: hypothetical protein NTW78_06740 [Campylobacterales bacterium]|nr:hypothetical protein [Campylobacterales bacterium]